VDSWFVRFRQCGDPAALARVFDRTAPEILRLATHLTRDMRTDRRYRAAPMVQLAPMAVPRGAGLGVAGAW